MTPKALAQQRPAPAETEIAIAVQALGRRFGEREALRDVTFSVAQGERLALLGPNGSGKSTLLRILATLLRPSSGGAAIQGHDVAGDPAAVRRCLGTAFQSPSLDGKLTVTENLRFQGYLFGLSGRELAARIALLLERFGLTERARERAEALSGGMKRRVELAKTLLHRPAVLLLDEPSTGLDPAARREFWELLIGYQREAELTVVVATHLLDEADRCGRVALLHEGRLVALDSPEALKAGVGRQVVTVETPDPPALADRIVRQLGIAATPDGGCVRLEAGGKDGGLELAARVLHAFPREALAVRLGHPSLEDAFLALTGHTIADTQEPRP
jgi:ABC-2 type transport system ATP-binding protein